jgi:hypothetical protein
MAKGQRRCYPALAPEPTGRNDRQISSVGLLYISAMRSLNSECRAIGRAVRQEPDFTLPVNQPSGSVVMGVDREFGRFNHQEDY